MRKVISKLLRQNYVTKSPTQEVQKVLKVSTELKTVKTSRSISFSSSPGSIPTTPSVSSSNVSPFPISAVTSAAPYPLSYPLPQVKISPDKESVVERERRRRSYYSSLLASAVDMIVWSYHGQSRSVSRQSLISQLNVKQVLSKNEGMKKVILKVAAMALNQGNEEIVGGGSSELHPFITTAGEVFFGANYNDLEDGQEYIQDIWTPGLLVLLLNTLISPEKISLGPSDKHVLLAKALVETSAGYLLHRTVQETNHLLEDTPESSRDFERMHQGNKLATLTGDLLVVSLIKNVSCTGNNKVLELVMNSLSEFSTTEISKQKPFEATNDPKVYKALLPSSLAESEVFSKGFQSSIMLSGVISKEALEWAAHLGTITGLLWKTNFDWMKLRSQDKRVENLEELNSYLGQLRLSADSLVKDDKIMSKNHSVVNVFRDLFFFWGQNKLNFS